jgi:hypothetical protein
MLLLEGRATALWAAQALGAGAHGLEHLEPLIA